MNEPSLKIRIPERLFAPAEQEHLAGACEMPVLKSGPDLYSFAEPVEWAVDITNTGGAFLVSGTVEGRATGACGRCLSDATFDLVGEVEGYFVFGDEEAPEELDADEFDLLPDDHVIDLEPLLETALRLELPLVPLCKDDCQGICPTCGQNLNEGACDCVADDGGFADAANPFAKLADLKLD